MRNKAKNFVGITSPEASCEKKLSFEFISEPKIFSVRLLTNCNESDGISDRDRRSKTVFEEGDDDAGSLLSESKPLKSLNPLSEPNSGPVNFPEEVLKVLYKYEFQSCCD